MTDAEIRAGIIIGAGRSGTKFLRGVLATSKLTFTVPFDVNYIWRQGNENAVSDELDPVSCTPVVSSGIRAVLMQQAGLSPAYTQGVLLEKSVPNTLRVPFVAQVFPEARFIHLIRDGRDVVESAYRSWIAWPDFAYLLRKARTFPIRNWRYALWYARHILMGKSESGERLRTWGPRYNGIDEDVRALPLEVVVGRQWVRCVQAALDGLATFPEGRVLEIRYEDLVRSSKSVERAARFLDLPDVDAVVRTYNEQLSTPKALKGWRETFTETQRERLRQEIGPMLERLGYDTV